MSLSRTSFVVPGKKPYLGVRKEYSCPGKFPDILLVLSADNFCRQFEPRSGLEKRFERNVFLYL